ncbi:hypothetical protein BH10PSE19_BH10PSE19_01660 [soil metagenome]
MAIGNILAHHVYNGGGASFAMASADMANNIRFGDDPYHYAAAVADNGKIDVSVMVEESGSAC